MNDGGQAFPVGSHGMDYVEGMSLRDYFAAKAMQALLQNPDPCLVIGPGKKNAVKAAYEIADAMLRERSKPTETREG